MKFAKNSFRITPTPPDKPIKGKRRTFWTMCKTAVGQIIDGVSGWIGFKS